MLTYRENDTTFVIPMDGTCREEIDYGASFASNGISNSTGLRLTGPSGGLIFYAKPSYSYDASGPFTEANGGTPWRYLELSPIYTDSGTGGSTLGTMRWGRGDILTGATAGADGYIGTGAPAALSTDGLGLENSYKMWAVDQNRSYYSAYNAVEATNAIVYCFGLHAGGYSDWYLPSAGEYYYIWWNLVSNRESGRGANTHLSGTGFASSLYWSSSEGSATSARWQSFISGFQSNDFKDDGNRVRAVRRF